MKVVLYLLLLVALLSVSLSTVRGQNPYDPVSNDAKVNAFFVWSKSLKNENGPISNLHVIHPDVGKIGYQNGTEVVVFVGGFGGNMFSNFYSNFLTHVAAKSPGRIVVGMTTFPQNPIALDKATEYLLSDLMWLQQNLINEIQSRNNGRKIKSGFKVDKFVLLGHSSGAQNIVGATLQKTDMVTALGLLDPVDGDPVNWTTPIIQPNIRMPSVPALVVVSGRCRESDISIPGVTFPPCCPAGRDGPHFYDAFTQSNRFYMNATAYGHADVLDNPLAWGAHFARFCSSVKDRNRNPFDTYRRVMGGAVVSFLNVVSGQCGYMKYLNDAKNVPTAVTIANSVVTKSGCFAK